VPHVRTMYGHEVLDVLESNAKLHRIEAHRYERRSWLEVISFFGAIGPEGLAFSVESGLWLGGK
jgi:hypothetical protein